MENSPNRFISDLYKKADFVDYFTSIQAINEVVHGKRIHIDSKARVLFTGRYPELLNVIALHVAKICNAILCQIIKRPIYTVFLQVQI